MNWIIASVITTLLWGGYGIFAEKAIVVHGERVSFAFEILGMIAIGLFVFIAFGSVNEFGKVTVASAFNATIMGLMTSAGAFMLLYAMRLAPSMHEIPVVIIIAGFYPIVSAVLAHFMLGSRLSPVQWCGVALAGVALALVNWTK